MARNQTKLRIKERKAMSPKHIPPRLWGEREDLCYRKGRLNINTFSIGSCDCNQYRQCEPRKKFAHLTLLSVAPLLAETIKRIHTGESVGALFK